MPQANEKDKWRARLFTNGRSQAVRLPKPLRFSAEEVLIWREGDRLIMEPIPRKTWPEGYWESLDALGSRLEDEVEPMDPGFLDLELE